MIERICIETFNNFENTAIDKYIVMPIHFHGVIVPKGGHKTRPYDCRYYIRIQIRGRIPCSINLAGLTYAESSATVMASSGAWIAAPGEMCRVGFPCPTAHAKEILKIIGGTPQMKLDRLLGILTVLLQNDRVTAPELAEKFEVNRRTIGRDIDALCQAGIPIVTHQGVGGGITIAEGFKLDKSVLTTEELSGIVAALKGIGSISERSKLERTLDKLRANSDAVVSMREPVIIDLASHYKGQLTGKIETIKRAVLEARLIEFDYFYEKGESRRRIEPYFIIFQWSSWYVFGFCLERYDWRMFKLLRL